MKSKREKALFIRNTDGIGVDEKNFPEGIDNEEKTNDNRLFLSLCAQLNGSTSKKITLWFRFNFNPISGIDGRRYQGYSKEIIHKNSSQGIKAKTFFCNIKLGFNDIETKEDEEITLMSQHHIYDEIGNKIGVESFPIEKMESEGTQKLIDLSGPIFDTLEWGKILVIDELDAKMHPLISQHVIRLFNSPETNPNNAQLIFTTHDTNLLSSTFFRRDQIWFTEKDTTEQTDLYNMMDIVLPDGSKPRNDANYEKNYIAGRYGAIPYIINN